MDLTPDDEGELDLTPVAEGELDLTPVDEGELDLTLVAEGELVVTPGTREKTKTYHSLNKTTLTESLFTKQIKPNDIIITLGNKLFFESLTLHQSQICRGGRRDTVNLRETAP